VKIPALTFGRVATQDLLRRAPGAGKPQEHLDAAISWLRRAHDKSPDDGVSYGFSLLGGWRPSYIETSGYIAETFFELAGEHPDQGYGERAVAICRWLVEVQNSDGSFANPAYNPEIGIVFDTGQDLFGLVRAYEETGDEAFLEAAGRAGNWLVEIADSEGRWTRNTHNAIPHVYNARVAWALLYLNSIDPDPDPAREQVARANLDWALSQQQANGFFDQCAFTADAAPFTHTIAYAIRGLLEAGRLLEEAKYQEAATRGAEAVAKHVQENGFIPGQIDIQGRPSATYSCLTGNCQLAIIWGKLFEQSGNVLFRDAASNALGYVMAHQDIATFNLDIRGAIKGSHPVWGAYSRLTYPNWATKFFIDAMRVSAGWLP
jgi:hypothetical protein